MSMRINAELEGGSCSDILTSRGAKLPHSPDRRILQRLTQPVFPVPAGTILHRIYFRGGRYACTWKSLRHFGPADARFDHHKRDRSGRPFDQARGIICLASDIPTALADVFQVGRMVDRERHQPWLASFALTREVRLLDLSGMFCVQAGGSMKLISGPKTYARNWSRAFYACYGNIEGICYPSSLTNRPVAALYERVSQSPPFPSTPALHRALTDALLVDPIRGACRDIGYNFL